MKKTGSILLSVITAFSMITSVLPWSVTAEDTGRSTEVQSENTTDDSVFLRVFSDPLQFDLAEGYDVADSAKQVAIKNIGTESLRYEGCIVSQAGFAVNPITASGGFLAAGKTASFRVTPAADMAYDTTAHHGELIFKYSDAAGSLHKKTVGFDWRVNAEYSSDLTVSPATIDFGTLTEGYSAPEARTVIITNSEASLKATAYRPSSKYLTIGELVCGNDKFNQKAVVSNSKSVSFTVTLAEGRKAGTYEDKLDITFADEKGKVSVKTVTVSYTIKAKEENKEKEKHTVEIEQSAGGVSGILIGNTEDMPLKATVEEGTKVSISASPDNGYVFSKWEITSGSLKLEYPNSSITSFTMGKSDIKLSPVFTKISEGSHSVTVSGQLGGSAWTETPIAKKGANVSVHAVPDDGYRFVKYIVYMDGKAVSETEGYNEISFDIPDKDILISAFFEPDPYKVILSTSGLGEAKAGKYTGSEGDVVYIAASPEKGYKFKEWKVISGGAVIEDKTAQSTKFTFGSADAKIQAVFVKREYNINIITDGNGTATAEPVYNEPGKFLLTAYPDDGWKLTEWKVFFANDIKTVKENSFYLTCGNTEEVDVTVKFEKAPVVTTVTTATTDDVTDIIATSKITDTKNTDISTDTAPTSETVTTSVSSDTSKTTTSKVTTSKTTTSKTTKDTASSKTTKTSTAKTTTSKTTSDTTGSTVSTTEETTIDYRTIVFGDADLDDKVDLADVTYLAKHLLSPISNPLGDTAKGTAARAKASADVTGDGKVDILDLSKIIEYNLGKLMLTDLDPRQRNR